MGENEITYADIYSGTEFSQARWIKIKGACRTALEDGYDYIWIDSCCTMQSHHRWQCPTKMVVATAENDGRRHPVAHSFKYQT
jgi:hypothetical protein